MANCVICCPPDSVTRPVLRVEDVIVRPQSQTISVEVSGGMILGLAGLEGQGQVEFAEITCGRGGR